MSSIRQEPKVIREAEATDLGWVYGTIDATDGRPCEPKAEDLNDIANEREITGWLKKPTCVDTGTHTTWRDATAKPAST